MTADSNGKVAAARADLKAGPNDGTHLEVPSTAHSHDVVAGQGDVQADPANLAGADVQVGPVRASRAATVAAYVYGLIVAAGIGYFLLGIPIQLTDCFGNMLKLDTPWRQLMIDEFTQRAYLRPLLWAELKLVYDVSGGSYFEWFRGTHVAQVVALVLLYLGLVRPRTWRDAAIVPLGLAVLVGMHTFTGMVTEAFPINTFLTVVLCCLAAANLVLMEHRWWVDALAITLLIIAALTVESGLLVWVVLTGGALVGAKGVSRPAVGGLAVLLAGYFVLRFVVLDVGSPGLIERASGYGFRMLEPEQLVQQFGANPTGFYAYNVASSVLSVLFSEPRGGVFRLLYGLSLNDPEPSAIVNVIASTCATFLIALYAWRRRTAWLRVRFDRDDRIVLLFVMVLGANAVISYPYTKDVIVSPAGAFYAAAVFVAARHVLPSRGSLPAWRSAVVATACLVLASTWAIRAVGLHLNLRESARKVRIEWAYAEDWFARQNITIDAPRELALLRHLQRDAIFTHPASPRLPLVDHEIFDVD